MARVQVNATARPTTTGGYQAEVGRGTDLIAAITAAADAAALVTADATVAGDPTALGLAEDAEAAIAAIAAAATKDVAVNFDTSTVTSQSQLDEILRRVSREVKSMGVI